MSERSDMVVHLLDEVQSMVSDPEDAAFLLVSAAAFLCGSRETFFSLAEDVWTAVGKEELIQ